MSFDFKSDLILRQPLDYVPLINTVLLAYYANENKNWELGKQCETQLRFKNLQ